MGMQSNIYNMPCGFFGALPQGDGSSITVEPGLILGEVNRLLAAYAKKNKLPIQYKMVHTKHSRSECK
jgi:D-lactate dehydrogenase